MLYGPGEIPIVNRSGSTIPAGSLARVNGRDVTYTGDWAVYQPDADDQDGICLVPEQMTNGKRGTGLLFAHPRSIKHSLGAPPAAGSFLGATSGAWTAKAGTKLRVWSGDATWAVVTGNAGSGDSALGALVEITGFTSRTGDVGLYTAKTKKPSDLSDISGGTISALYIEDGGNTVKTGTLGHLGKSSSGQYFLKNPLRHAFDTNPANDVVWTIPAANVQQLTGGHKLAFYDVNKYVTANAGALVVSSDAQLGLHSLAAATFGSIGSTTAITAAADIYLGDDAILNADNREIIWGATNQGRIYHDGTDFIVDPKKSGVGVLRVGVADNISAVWGAGKDASIYWNGTNWIFDATLTDSAAVLVSLGDLQAGAVQSSFNGARAFNIKNTNAEANSRCRIQFQNAEGINNILNLLPAISANWPGALLMAHAIPDRDIVFRATTVHTPPGTAQTTDRLTIDADAREIRIGRRDAAGTVQNFDNALAWIGELHDYRWVTATSAGTSDFLLKVDSTEIGRYDQSDGWWEWQNTVAIVGTGTNNTALRIFGTSASGHDDHPGAGYSLMVKNADGQLYVRAESGGATADAMTFIPGTGYKIDSIWPHKFSGGTQASDGSPGATAVTDVRVTPNLTHKNGLFIGAVA